MDGALPVPRLHRSLGEEEVHFIVVSVGVVGDEVSGHEFGIWEGREGRYEWADVERAKIVIYHLLQEPTKKNRQTSAITFLTITD